MSATRRPRCSEFMFDPDRFRFDPIVMGMSPEARGVYVMLWCSSWSLPEPGVIEPATDQVLASLAFADSTTWLRVKDEVARAFDTTIDGRWTQKGTRKTLARQDSYIEQQRLAGVRSGEARRKRKARRQMNAVRTTFERASNGAPTALERPSNEPSTNTVLGSQVQSQSQRPLSSRVGTGSGSPPRAAGPSGPDLPDPPPPHGPGRPLPADRPTKIFATLGLRKPRIRPGHAQSHDDRLHRLCAAGIDSLVAEQLLRSEATARARLGQPPPRVEVLA